MQMLETDNGRPPAVRAHGLSKRFSADAIAVDSIDLEVPRGAVYGLLGPNGAGKSTTLRLLVDLVRPSSGTIEVLDAPPGRRVADIGIIIEEPAFYPYLTGRKNLELLARLAGSPLDEVDRNLETVGLAADADRRADLYSTGMRQRLGIAAALLNSPELLILDEPSAGLDPQGVSEVRELLVRLGDGERTIIVSSHLLSEIDQICRHVGILHDGHLVYQGALDDLRRRADPALSVRADPLDRAVSAVAELGLSYETDGATGLDVAAPGERAPEIVRAMVNSQVDVFEISEQTVSLEDAYLELTSP